MASANVPTSPCTLKPGNPTLTKLQRDQLILRRETLIKRAEVIQWSRPAHSSATPKQRRFEAVAMRLKFFIAGVRDGKEWMVVHRANFAAYQADEVDHVELAERTRWLGLNTSAEALFEQFRMRGQLNALDRTEQLQAAE